MSQMLLEEPAAPPIETAPPQATVAQTYAHWSGTPNVLAPASEISLGFPWMPALVLGLAIAAGIGVYAFVWQHSRELWWWMGHDRHTHYMFGLNLAFDLRTGDVIRLFHDFDRMRVWGPLHPMLVAAIELVAGPDHRLAVLPSMCGWIMAIWFAFLIPRRLMDGGGNAAGLIAACLVAASPAHRAFAGDVMLESLGAGLSLAAIYLYLIVLQEQSRRSAILLGLTLTALFLHKYNYWLLVVLGLTVGEFARQPAAWLRWFVGQTFLSAEPAKGAAGRQECLPHGWIIGELKQPLNYIALACAAAAIAVVVTGGGTIGLGRWTVSIQEPHNVLHLAYVAFFLRLAWWWKKTGRTWSAAAMPATLRTVLLWHLSAVAVWFLLPKRLSYFFWYLGPNNDDQQRESVTFMHGLPTYLHGLQEDYLSLSWGIYLFGGMLALGVMVMAAALFKRSQLKPGSAALLFFFLIAACLTCQHPMLKHRFLHSWIAAGWIIGAIGLISAMRALGGLIGPTCRSWAAGIACAAVIVLHGPALLEAGHAQEGGLKPNEPSPLRITDTYLPALARFENPTIVSNVPTRFLWTWTFIEAHHHQKMAAEIKNFKTFEGNPDAARRWLESTRCDGLLLIDIHPGSVYDLRTGEYVDLAAFHQALAEQTAWVKSQSWEMPEGVSITLWQRR